jgi:hypothetical protein
VVPSPQRLRPSPELLEAWKRAAPSVRKAIRKLAGEDRTAGKEPPYRIKMSVLEKEIKRIGFTEFAGKGGSRFSSAAPQLEGVASQIGVDAPHGTTTTNRQLRRSDFRKYCYQTIIDVLDKLEGESAS